MAALFPWRIQNFTLTIASRKYRAKPDLALSATPSAFHWRAGISSSLESKRRLETSNRRHNK
jgi:hypothetical protein